MFVYLQNVLRRGLLRDSDPVCKLNVQRGVGLLPHSIRITISGLEQSAIPGSRTYDHPGLEDVTLASESCTELVVSTPLATNSEAVLVLTGRSLSRCVREERVTSRGDEVERDCVRRKSK